MTVDETSVQPEPGAATQPPAPETADARSTRGSDRRRRRRRWRLAGLAAGLVVLGAVLWFLAEAYPIGGAGRPVVFQVAAGESFSQVADTMAAKGIIGSTLAFRLDLLVMGTPTVQPGWYELPTSSSFSSVRSVLAGGPNATAVVVTTAESSREIALNLAGVEGTAFAQRFLSVVRNGVVPSAFQPAPGASIEGLLAPGTYVLVPHETPELLLAAMTSRFLSRAASVGLTPTTTRHGLDAYQLITAASIVEKEGYYARNMPKVATVLYNRLARGTPLQMDATVEYATGQDGGPITHATEAIASPYNTYLHTGLTPTPICIPSTEALDATMHAPPGPWLYFETIDNSGTMAFATTFAQQLANEALAASRGVGRG